MSSTVTRGATGRATPNRTTGPARSIPRRTLRAVLIGALTAVLGLAGTGIAAAATPPSAPTAVAASATGPGAAVLQWSPPTGSGGSAVTGYVVGRDGIDGNGTGAWSTTVAGTARSQTFTLLVPGRTYTLSVRAKTAAGSGPAATVTVTAATAPGAPSGATVVSSGWAPDFRSLTAEIAWNPPAGDGGSPITGYRISRDGYDTSGSGPWSTTVGPTTRSFTLTKLGPTMYTFTVAAITRAGTGAAASIRFPYTVPNYVHQPTITGTTVDKAAGSVTITWDFLYYGNHATMPDVVRVGRDGVDRSGSGPWSTTVPVASRSFTFTKLKAGATYTFTVDAWMNYRPSDQRGSSVTVTL